MQWKYGMKVAAVASVVVLCVACGGSDKVSSQSQTSVKSPVSATATESSRASEVPRSSGQRPTASRSHAPETPSSVTSRSSSLPPANPPKARSVQKGLIKLETGGDVGCGDTLVMVSEPNVVAGPDDIATAMMTLLRDKQGGVLGDSRLVNPLWQSNLRYSRSLVDGDTVTVYLLGTVVSSGTCDDPRIIAQLKHTAAVAAGVANAEVRINDIPVEIVLSEK